ncbi:MULTISPECIES: outer membrane protein assembly factor BamE [unclassified Hoeflea]|jgi:outer membrane protein assembly factor BamE (lipoprotein component of BamABCDE complex)|uniref:outer membrane protein assembly factor BamE n=1 Tax=unclassified Hoeflea TaxID=2614931 RepID=UPI002AFE508E|nr:outer membrane protein assembly factor BamE [Hoeflea sp.]
MSFKMRVFKATGRSLRLGAAIAVISTAAMAGCTTSEVFNQGYVVDQTALDLTPVGSSREQVLLSLGTPSTTATFDNEVFYYVSQKRTRAAMFLKPQLVEQSVLAVYFDEDGTVKQIANYTLQDGKVFDMISRTTPTGGIDKSFLAQVLSGAGSEESTRNAVARSILGGGAN